MGQLQQKQHTHNRNTIWRREEGREKAVKTIMIENFSELISDTKPQIQVAQIY